MYNRVMEMESWVLLMISMGSVLGSDGLGQALLHSEEYSV